MAGTIFLQEKLQEATSEDIANVIIGVGRKPYMWESYSDSIGKCMEKYNTLQDGSLSSNLKIT